MTRPPDAADADMFAVEQVQFAFPGPLLLAAAGSNTLCVVCRIDSGPAGGYAIVVLDLATPQNTRQVGLELKRSQDEPVGLALHPFGTFLLVFTALGDTYLLQPQGGSASRPKALGKLSGLHLCCATWTQPDARNGHSVAQPHASTGLVLAGSTTGRVYELELQPTPDYFRRTERLVRHVATLPTPEALVSVALVPFPSVPERYLAVLATPTRLYTVVGHVGVSPYGGRPGTGASGADTRDAIPSLTSLFRNLSDNPTFQEFPVRLEQARFDFFHPFHEPSGWPSTPQWFAWQTRAGVYRGDVVFGGRVTAETIWTHTRLLPYPDADAVPAAATPVPFHVLLLGADGRLDAVSDLTGERAWTTRLDGETPGEKMLTLVRDPIRDTVWLVTSARVLEVHVRHPERHVWRTFLARGQYELAAQYATTDADRDTVAVTQGNELFARGRFTLAAQCFAHSSSAVFLDVCEKFLAAGQPEGLRAYLRARLSAPADGAAGRKQRAIASNWLVKLYLHELQELEETRLLAELAGEPAPEDDAALCVTALKEALAQWLSALQRDFVGRLLYTQARPEIHATFARLTGDAELLAEHFMARGEVSEALRVLVDAGATDAVYRLIPLATALDANAAAAACAEACASGQLAWRRLLPAVLLQGPEAQGPAAALAFLDALASLKATRDEPEIARARLVASIQNARVDEETAAIDAVAAPALSAADHAAAVVLARRFGAPKTCVYALQTLGHVEQAVAAALDNAGSVKLAESVARRLPLDDLMLAARTWRAIVTHKIRVEHHEFTAVMKYVRHILAALETERRTSLEARLGGLDRCGQAVGGALVADILRVEDLLPLFEPSPAAGKVRDELARVLAVFDARVDGLRGEMSAARVQLEHGQAALGSWAATQVLVNADGPCAACGARPLRARQFYVFAHCRHAFHGDCLLRRVYSLETRPRQRALAALQSQLAAAVSAGPSCADSAKAALEELIARECPLCGTLAVGHLGALLLPDPSLE